MKPTASKSSPRSGRRACKCKDGTYSSKCCDGTLQAQGIGSLVNQGTSQITVIDTTRTINNP